MPLFIQDNLQGAGNSGVETPIAVPPPDDTLLLEWGHFIQNPENLLMIDGVVHLFSAQSEPGPVQVEVQISVDGMAISEYGVTFSAANQEVTLSLGARLENVTRGHHILRLIAAADTPGIVALDRSVTSISGRAT